MGHQLERYSNRFKIGYRPDEPGDVHGMVGSKADPQTLFQLILTHPLLPLPARSSSLPVSLSHNVTTDLDTRVSDCLVNSEIHRTTTSLVSKRIQVKLACYAKHRSEKNFQTPHLTASRKEQLKRRDKGGHFARYNRALDTRRAYIRVARANATKRSDPDVIIKKQGGTGQALSCEERTTSSPAERFGRGDYG